MFDQLLDAMANNSQVLGFSKPILDRFAGLKIFVIGDPMLDYYVFGHADRISPEAPIPVFVSDRGEFRDGGAANVAAQLEALGCAVSVGWTDEKHKWTNKNRYMVGHHQVFRHDVDQCVVNSVPALAGFHAVVISDYGKGACTSNLCCSVIAECLAQRIPVIVDPKGQVWEKYKLATVICPNDREYTQWSRQGWQPDNIIHKRGSQGLDVISRGRPLVHYEASAKHVFDVVGAGDVVVALIAAGLGAKASLEDAAWLATLAAGYAVGEIGTTVCPLERLRELCA